MSETIRSIGAQMATMMYNLSQGANLPAGTRDLMRDMHQRWDAAVSADKAPPPQTLLVGSNDASSHAVIGYISPSSVEVFDPKHDEAVKLYDERLEDSDIPVVAPWGLVTSREDRFRDFCDQLISMFDFNKLEQSVCDEDMDLVEHIRAALASAEVDE